ncbi:hypothetical protein JXI42_02620 [bacterium]|nr:hypothetical protein [bacterium]
MMKTKITIGVVLVIISIFLIFYAQWDQINSVKTITYSDSFTLKELAKKNNIPVKEILHQLSHEDISAWELPLEIPINELGIDTNKVKEAVEHAGTESKPVIDIIKFSLWSLLLAFVLIFVLSKKKIKTSRILILLSVIIIFGVVLGDSPNPMESLVKLFKVFNKMEGETRIIIPSFIIFTLFSITGSKLICGWGCHLGALQESIFNIPLFKKKYKFKLPFSISLISRITLFFIFIVLLFGLLTSIKNFVLFHHINYF